MPSSPGSWFSRALIIFAAFTGFSASARAESPLSQFGFEDFLLAPLRVHLLTSEDQPAHCTTLTEADIERIVTKVNRVWSQAGIGFHVESLLCEAAAPIKPEDQSTRSLHSLLSIIPPGSYGTEQFNIYYIKEFQVNGVYFPKAIFVKDTASLRRVPGGIDEPLPRVTSHELGHALGLPHRQDTTNLMASGTTGTALNAEEIESARTRAATMSRFVRAPQLLKRADELFETGKSSEARELYRRLAELPEHGPSFTRIRERLQTTTAPSEAPLPQEE